MGKFLQLVCFFCCACGAGTALAQEGVQIGVASGLELADFDNETGALTWQLKAQQAMPEVGRVARMDENAVWVLRDVAIRSFSKGKQFLTISTPECRYARGEKQASGPSAVTLEGELFVVNGEHWNWQRGAGGEEAVRIFRNVRVTLRPEGKMASPITIFSKEATATLRRDATGEGRTELVFTDGSPERVRVMMKDDKGNDIVLRSNRLTVRIRAGRTEIGHLAATDAATAGAKKQEAKKELEALEEIVAEENVWLHSQSRSMFGETATYRHGEQLFTVTGQPRVEDVKQEVTVRGGKLSYFLAREEILMEANPRSAAPVEQRVFLSVPSFTAKETGGLAQLTGDRLEIELRATANLIKMTGAVRGVDVDFNLESDYLEVETPHEAGLFQGSSVLERSAVNRIVARQQVRAVYEGRELRCEEATILPRTETVLLRGRPAVAVPKSGARLSGHAIDLKKTERTITVIAEPGAAPTRQRVVVALPPLKMLAAAGAGAVESRDTTVASERLVMTEDATGTTATFDFSGAVVLRGTDMEGSCERLEILADRQRGVSGTRGEMAGAAQIQRVVATGGAVLGTSRFVAEGERAEIFPKVALEEKSAHEQNGLDGHEPQFISLHGDPAAPGSRPRLTLVNPGALAGTAKENAAIDRLTVTSDFMEIVNGREQDRFFLRGNVRLEGTDLDGSCDIVEGRIVSEAAARGKKNWAVTQIQGRGGVVFRIEDNKASGEVFEMFPDTRKVYLTGSPRVRSGDGVEAIPGRRIVYDWASKNWSLEGQRGAEGQPVARPEIRIPLKRRNP